MSCVFCEEETNTNALFTVSNSTVPAVFRYFKPVQVSVWIAGGKREGYCIELPERSYYKY
jgi:hypothetical protein